MTDILGNLWQGAIFACNLTNFAGCVFGYAIGVIAGAIPGIMGITALALMLPFTFTMSPLFAIAAMMGCYKGAAFAGSITAILFNIPGTPEAAATVLDGHPMAKQGQQARALEIALWASFIGGMISNFLLIFTAPPLAKIAVHVGPAETAALILFSLTAVISLMGSSRVDIWKGLISVIIGLGLATIGLDPITSTRRYGFGFTALDSGITYVVGVIAFLAFVEILDQVGKTAELKVSEDTVRAKNLPYTWAQRWADLKYCAKDVLRSSLIGSFLGAMPGIGAPPAAFICYGEAKRVAGPKSRFGYGDPRGIAAPESGNNAVAASSLIPLITLGVPGSVAAAVLGGAFMVKGMIPGPMLMHDHPQVIYGLFVLFIVADILGAFLVALPALYFMRKLLGRLNLNLLFPAVILCCAVGVYTEHFDIFAIKMLVVLGSAGYCLHKLGFALSPLVLAFILGPILERETRTALIISGGSYGIFFTSPVACVLLILTVGALGWSIRQKIKVEKGEGSGIIFEEMG
ncbi:MAG: tripartite tricarboxylate transporter permease [Desulfovibrionaceae bacterium]|nr:tripartite tricarboxylate transporter permease [Desulfovibrionaceae bacterium]